MNKLVQKILIGKLFRFFPKHPLFVIVGVKNSPYKYGYEILIARYYEESKEAEVYSWYGYYESELYFENRSPKEHIRKCLKTHPDKIKYHLGKSVKIEEIKIYDNSNTKDYSKYLKQILIKNV